MKMNKAEKYIFSLIESCNIGGVNQGTSLEEAIRANLYNKFCEHGKTIPPEYKDAAYKWARVSTFGLNPDKRTDEERMQEVLDKYDNLRITKTQDEMANYMRKSLAEMERFRKMIIEK